MEVNVQNVNKVVMAQVQMKENQHTSDASENGVTVTKKILETPLATSSTKPLDVSMQGINRYLNTYIYIYILIYTYTRLVADIHNYLLMGK